MICRICKKAICTPQNYMCNIDGVCLCNNCACMLASEGLIEEGADDEWHFTARRIDEILDLL